MKVYKIPNYKTGFGTDQQNIEDCQLVGILPRGFGIFTPESWAKVSPYTVNQGFGAKYWRDNSTIWNPQANYTYLRIARDSNSGGYLKVQPTSPEPTATALGLSTINFYNTYQVLFPTRPYLELVQYSYEDANRLNFATDSLSDPVPIGSGINITSTSNPQSTSDLSVAFPHDVALRFNSNEVEAFFISEFMKENPVPSSGGVRAMSDFELVNSLQAILGSGMDIPNEAKAIRLLLK